MGFGKDLQTAGTLEDLVPAIEAVYHFCSAGEFTSPPHSIASGSTATSNSNWPFTRLGAHEVALDAY
jgi:hypothetical protein